MNVLVLNGSPRGERSNSLCLTRAFLKGMEDRISFQAEILPVCRMNIRPCAGCFKCWKDTPGICCIPDDMAGVIEKIIRADLVVWSFPLYFFSLPPELKALMDRQLPMLLPYMAQPRENGADGGSHVPRYNLSGQRHILISTCGFYTAQYNYEAVKRQFYLCYGQEKVETIFCGQGELFAQESLRARTSEYLAVVRTAGTEYMQNGITERTRERLAELLFPRDDFERSANASWPAQKPAGV